MIKKLINSLACAGILLVLAAPAMAEGRQNVEVGLGYSMYDYKEELDAPLKSTEEGWVPHFSVGYTYHGEDNPTYANISFRYGTASTDYDGTLQDGTPAKGKTDNSFYNFEVKFGYIMGRGYGNQTEIIPYAGVGYHRWERNLGGDSPYNEEYTWFYFPIGVKLDYKASSQFTIGLDLSARIMFNGAMNVKFPVAGYSSPTLDLGNRIGFRVEVPMDYRFHPQISLGLTPWYQYTPIGRSEAEPVLDPDGATVMTIQEPDSKTHEYGADVSVRFWF